MTPTELRARAPRNDESLKLAKELSDNSLDHIGSCGENP